MIRFTPWLGAFLGGTFFFLVYGAKILDPEFIQWTMKGDAAQHFLGWHLFRSESWGFPLGIIRSLQYPEGTSIVYTDSIPLLAIPLKLLSSILPEMFQYHGLWLLLIYILQGFFAVLLLSLFSKNPWLILLGSLFFLMNPVLMQRSRGHEALAAHWLILAALYLYFQKDSFRTRLLWGITSLLAVLTHFYLLFMVLVIWGGYLLKIYLEVNRANLKEVCLFAVRVLLATLIAMWWVGYFVIKVKSSASGGFGHFSMNVLAPINPVPHNWFTFLTPVPFAVSGQHEGNNYLGFGVLLLVFIAIYEFVQNRHKFIKKISLPLPLLIACVLLFLLSISNKVTFSDQVLFEIPLSDSLYAALGILRSSGRLFWPVAYCIMLAAIVVIIRSSSGKQSAQVLFVLILVQVIDFWPMYRNFSLENKIWKSPLVSSHWDSLAKQYKHIVMVPADRQGNVYVPFALLAAKYGMTINVGYTARFDREVRHAYQQQLMQNIQNRQFEGDSIYLFRDQQLLDTVKTNTQINSVILDGVSVAAYKLKERVPELFSQ